jgi:hypothetical protein
MQIAILAASNYGQIAGILDSDFHSILVAV